MSEADEAALKKMCEDTGYRIETQQLAAPGKRPIGPPRLSKRQVSNKARADATGIMDRVMHRYFDTAREELIALMIRAYTSDTNIAEKLLRHGSYGPSGRMDEFRAKPLRCDQSRLPRRSKRAV